MRSIQSLVAPLLAFAPFALLACGAAPDGQTSSEGVSQAEPLTIALCPAGQTRQCTSEGLSGGLVCSCVWTQTHSVGGTISGLSGSLTLQATDDASGAVQTVTANGPYHFTLVGKDWTILPEMLPAGQACVVSSSQGSTLGNVSDVNVTCSAATYVDVEVASSLLFPEFEYTLTEPGAGNFASQGTLGTYIAVPWALPAYSTATFALHPYGYQTCAVKSTGTLTGTVTTGAPGSHASVIVNCD